MPLVPQGKGIKGRAFAWPVVRPLVFHTTPSPVRPFSRFFSFHSLSFPSHSFAVVGAVDDPFGVVLDSSLVVVPFFCPFALAVFLHSLLFLLVHSLSLTLSYIRLHSITSPPPLFSLSLPVNRILLLSPSLSVTLSLSLLLSLLSLSLSFSLLYALSLHNDYTFRPYLHTPAVDQPESFGPHSPHLKHESQEIRRQVLSCLCSFSLSVCQSVVVLSPSTSSPSTVRCGAVASVPIPTGSHPRNNTQ